MEILSKSYKKVGTTFLFHMGDILAQSVLFTCSVFSSQYIHIM